MVFFSCRWDLGDTYFKYKNNLLDRFKGYTPDSILLREYFSNSKLLSIFELPRAAKGPSDKGVPPENPEN